MSALPYSDIASLHSITVVASASMVGGIVRPSTFAVLRLIVRSASASPPGYHLHLDAPSNAGALVTLVVNQMRIG